MDFVLKTPPKPLPAPVDQQKKVASGLSHLLLHRIPLEADKKKTNG